MEASEQTTETFQTFQCVECGKTFKNAQGLGAHRARTHGYRSPRLKAARRKDGTPVLAPVAPPVDPFAALTASLFPEGIPANREVLAGLLDLMTSYERLLDLVTR